MAKNVAGNKLGFLFIGTIAFATGGYFVFNTVRQGNIHKFSELQVVQLGPAKATEAIFDDNASWYDSKIDTAETVMGLKLLRRYMIGKAKGNVLEVGGGTARNLSYYSPDFVTSVTLVDFSTEMLVRAHKKAEDLAAENQRIVVLPVGEPLSKDLFPASASPNISAPVPSTLSPFPSDFNPNAPAVVSVPMKTNNLFISTRKMDVHKLDYPDQTFDTVIDTFGLCSFDDPVSVIHEMQRVCKPDGRILLLEHGRSEKWKFISDLLDNGALQHHQNWGCWWNRNMIELAIRAGIPLTNLKTFHFGTTTLLETAPIRVDRSNKLHLLKKDTIINNPKKQ
jgi:methyltransferase OMS1